MKKLFFILVSCILVMGLNARENPFEPTDVYKEKQVEFLKQLALQEQAEQQKEEEIKLHEEALLQREKELEDLATLKQDELRKIEELKAQRAVLEKQQKQKLLQMKKQKMVKKNKYNVLPFVHIEANNDTLTLYVDTKFKLINQDILKKRKKILYDFRGYTSFYTIRKTLQSDAFKAFSVGTHKSKGFFRVVIEVADNTSLYTESINTREGKITIKKM